MQSSMITTGLELPGHVVVRNIGVVRGITVRSRSIVGNFFGGNITIYTSLCERARLDAFELMREQAHRAGANAVIGMRYDTPELMAGLTEVLCYGTAVLVQPQSGGKSP